MKTVKYYSPKLNAERMFLKLTANLLHSNNVSGIPLILIRFYTSLLSSRMLPINKYISHIVFRRYSSTVREKC